jgi:hypothetical protein
VAYNFPCAFKETGIYIKIKYVVQEKLNLFYSAIELPTLVSLVLSSSYVSNYNVVLLRNLLFTNIITVTKSYTRICANCSTLAYQMT